MDTLRATGEGTNSEWTASTGTKYGCVDEDSPNDDADYVYAPTSGYYQEFTMSDIAAITSVDSVWIKVQWTYMRQQGGPIGLGLYYYDGSSWSTDFNVATTKSGTYVLDSVKWTSPTVANVNAMQVRSFSGGSDEWRVTWWQAVVYGTAAGSARSQIMRTTITE